VKRYLQGHYGATPAPVNAELRTLAIGHEPVIDGRPADLIPAELARLREEIGDLAKNEEDVLTFAMFPDLGKTWLSERRDGKLKPEALRPPAAADGEKAGVSAATPTEFVIDVHGESYRVAITGVGAKGVNKRHVYLTLDGMPEEVVFEALNEYVPEHGKGRKSAHKDGDVTTTMPGNIVDVLVKEGDTVKAGQPVLITEAMKMEAEIQAPIAGRISAVHVKKGDRVTPGEVLVEITA